MVGLQITSTGNGIPQDAGKILNDFTIQYLMLNVIDRLIAQSQILNNVEKI